VTSLVETTVGRAMLSEILPRACLSALNKALKKKEISKLINTSFRKCGLKATVVFADKLLQNGFRLAARRYLDLHRRHAGASAKADILARAESK
jgi:DNA-directed RNA polymerase subunit beta'